MQENQERLQNLLVSKDFSTFSLLEQKRIDLPVGDFETVPTGTDLDEYNQWMNANGGVGVGEIIYDGDDARDAAEFAALANDGGRAESVTDGL